MAQEFDGAVLICEFNQSTILDVLVPDMKVGVDLIAGGMCYALPLEWVRKATAEPEKEVIISSISLPNSAGDLEKDKLFCPLCSYEMAVEVPLLVIAPIPNLQIDEVNILFDMEVKQSEKSEQSLGMDASLEVSAKISPFSISIKGSMSSHSSNTRSSDNSAKYHVDVHGTPEALPACLT